MQKLIILSVLITLISCEAHAHRFTVLFSHTPPIVLAKENKISGAGYAISSLAFRKIGVEFKPVAVPWARALKMVENGEADALFGAFSNPKWSSFMEIVEIPDAKTEKLCIYTNAEHQNSIHSLAALKNLRVGILSSTSHLLALPPGTSLTLDEAPCAKLNFDKLLKGRVDAVLCLENCGDFVLKKKHLTDRIGKASCPLGIRCQNFIGISKVSPLIEHRKALKQAVDSLHADGVLQEILASPPEHCATPAHPGMAARD